MSPVSSTSQATQLAPTVPIKCILPSTIDTRPISHVNLISLTKDAKWHRPPMEVDRSPTTVARQFPCSSDVWASDVRHQKMRVSFSGETFYWFCNNLLIKSYCLPKLRVCSLVDNFGTFPKKSIPSPDVFQLNQLVMEILFRKACPKKLPWPRRHPDMGGMGYRISTSPFTGNALPASQLLYY